MPHSEVEICQAMKAFLIGRGWRVHQEVPLPMRGRRIDLLAIKGDCVLGVEAKRSYTRELQCQAQDLVRYCDLVSVVVAAKPSAKSMSKAGVWGFGVYTLREGKVLETLAPDPSAGFGGSPVPGRRQSLLDWCGTPGRCDGADAGSRMLEGGGMAQRLAPLLREFFGQNPRASWKDAFARVPNHYASVASMRGVMKGRL